MGKQANNYFSHILFLPEAENLQDAENLQAENQAFPS